MRRAVDYLSKGKSITARALRGSAISGMGHVTGQVLRLGSNLILTRLLFPDAFGLMALVTMLVVGVIMMSDMGLAPSIMQNKRGDEPSFLNTAWSVRVMLHGFYFVAMCLLAYPASVFYDAPELVQLVPAVGIALLMGAFVSPNVEYAMRHLNLGRVTLIDLASQAVGIAVMVIHAWLTGSIWALVTGQVVTALVKPILVRHYLDGPATRPQWDPEAAHDLIHFGKWILLSSVCGFFLAQGDKLILGKYLSLEQLGIYNIGFFLALFPVTFAENVVGRAMIPVYRDTPPQESRQNFRTVQRMRFGLTVVVMSMVAFMGLAGPWIVDLLYDERYLSAGMVVSAIACAQIPQILGMSYNPAILAAGDSRRFSFLVMFRAAIMMTLMLIGAELYGLYGAIFGQMCAGWIMHVALVRLVIRHRVWDPVHDILFGGIGLLLTITIIMRLT